MRKSFFTVSALEQVGQRGYGASIFHPTAHNLEQPALVDPVLTWEVGADTSRGALQPQDSVILHQIPKRYWDLYVILQTLVFYKGIKRRWKQFLHYPITLKQCYQDQVNSETEFKTRYGENCKTKANKLTKTLKNHRLQHLYVQHRESMKLYTLQLITAAIVEKLSLPSWLLIRHNADLKTKN